MKKITLVLLLLAASSFLFLLAGCSEDDSGMSIEDRIEAFVSDLSDSNRDGIFKEHFHPDSDSYSTGDEDAVNAVFPNATGYTVSSISGSGSSRTGYISGGNASATGTYTFNMKEEDDDDWLILNVYDGGTEVLP